MVRTPARPSGRRRSLAATAACLAGLTLAPAPASARGTYVNPGSLPHGGAGAVAEFDYLRIYRS
jgi:hypothetical protein